jgi:hypothetical protein
MTVLGLLLLAMLVMKRWPETDCAKWLRRHLVEAPLDLAEHADRKQILAIVILLVMFQGAAMMISADVAFALSLDYATFLDAAVTVWTIAAVNRSRSAISGSVAHLRRIPAGLAMRLAPRARRGASVRAAAKPSANDDDGHGDFALAA